METITKTWKCANGHVLGLARQDGSTVQHLLLYREAMDMAPGADQVDVDVIAVISSATNIRCSVCGDIRTWYLDPEYLRRLLKKQRGGRHAYRPKLTLDI